MTPRQMTVCLIEIERFAVATRHMETAAVVAFLQGFYERVGDVLLSHNGRLIKYIGDAVLVTFDKGQEEVAVRAMWTLAEGYRDYADPFGPELAVSVLGVGVATGEVVAGQIGHPQMLAYDVFGKPVSIAAALVRLGGVIIDRATYQIVGERVTVEEADPTGLVRGYRVTGFK